MIQPRYVLTIGAAAFAAGQATLPGEVRAADAIGVELIELRQDDVGVDLSLTGTLEARESVDLGFRRGGRITEVLVLEGDHFARGEVLARIDPQQSEQSLNAAQASFAAAEAAEQQARLAAERAAAMLERGVGTRAARDTARQALSAAETQTKQAQSALDQARRTVEDTDLTAPFDGVVTARQGEPGQVVGAAQSVLSLAAMSGIEAVFLTPDMAMLDDAMGQPVALRTLDVSAAPMTARVTEIAPLVEASTGSVRLRAEVADAPDDVSLLGAAVSGTIRISEGSAVRIPWTALSSDAGAPAVWLVGEGGRAELREVAIESFENGFVLLESGVAAGDVIVGAGSQRLYPGRQVVAAEIDP
ncbi:RND family efflux transporter, MFP subunit [Paracoccus isoporae]|uniref:RND family efflux transporter, MFP subunit n=1 Tax=Paracoccus isoporae TaxID=591205 RepID=A0A1G6Z3D2_9RHOB|nr:efflux RND transporter periplasmic adaptor subunit [Paracoccus isoporae]SDD97274.1 RND family efflux transporter, MFP subunit [Paracoccus isoporae]